MMRSLVILLVASRLCQDGAAVKDCKAANDYERSECGDTDENRVCCTFKQHCIGPVKPKEGKELFKCSEERKLSGHKAMKIVLIPMIFMIMDILFVVYMVWKLDIKGNHVTKLCVAAIAVSWPWLFGAHCQFFAVYSAFLAILVAFTSTRTDFPRWMFRIVWAMLIFQVILLFGPNEAFHVPLYKQSNAFFSTSGSTQIANLYLAVSEKSCSEYYGNYFKYVDIEKQEVDFNPDAEYFGLCTEEFIGFVQTMAFVQGVVWMATAMVSASTFLPGDETKVEEVKGKSG